MNNNTGACGMGASGPAPAAPISLETLETNQHSLLDVGALVREDRRVRSRRRREKRGREHRDLVSSLRVIGFEDLAADVSSCGRLLVAQCGACQGKAARQCFSCKCRLCPWCAQTKGERRAERLGPAIETFSNPVLLTLTIKNRQNLADADAHLRASWKKLSRRKAFRSAFAGGFVFEETTYHQETGGWHAHLHIIADGWFKQELLAELWEDCTGDSRVVHISWIKPQARAKAIREACKYPTKLSTINGDPRLVLEFLEYFKGRRMCWSWGSARGLLACEEIDEDDQVELEMQEQAAHFCPHCGALDSMTPCIGETWRREDCETWGGGVWFVLDDPPPRPA